MDIIQHFEEVLCAVFRSLTFLINIEFTTKFKSLLVVFSCGGGAFEAKYLKNLR